MESVFEILFKYKPYLFEKGRIVFDSQLPNWFLLAAAVSIVLVVILLNRWRWGLPSESRFSRFRNVLPIVLRSVVLLALLAVIARPTLVVSTLLPHENIVAVLVDDSKSMTVKDAAGGQPRLSQLKQILSPESKFLSDLHSKFQTRVFRFSRQAEPMRSAGELAAAGSGTDLEEGLKAVLSEFSTAPLVSVVLLSDGADNLSRDLTSLLGQYRSRKVAVNVVGIGEPEIARDIEVTQASAPHTVMPESTIQAVLSVRSSGYTGETAVVEIREAGKLVNTKEIALQGGSEPQIVEVDLQPRGTGLKSYTIGIAPKTGETIAENNSQNFLVKVDDTKPSIMNPPPRWLTKSLRSRCWAGVKKLLSTLPIKTALYS